MGIGEAPHPKEQRWPVKPGHAKAASSRRTPKRLRHKTECQNPDDTAMRPRGWTFARRALTYQKTGDMI
jgi:hypothetical protein